jgi:hypothetical protein
MSFKSHKDIISAWPSLSALAADMDVPYATVQKWHSRNSIPADKWKRVAKHALLRDIEGVTVDLLAELRGRSAGCNAEGRSQLSIA